jgi:hypothetical protein
MIKPPYPYFGGKMAARDLIWQRLGYTLNRVDPFFGGGSFLWIDPGFDWQAGDWRDDRPRIETANDIDGFIANFWRAVQCDPAAVAEYADRPVNENDLHAIHSWLINNPPDTARLEADPDYYDAKIAGWWVWGVCVWIGSGFCSGKGPWQVVDGRLINGNAGRGINRQLPHLGNAGQGINRQLPHLGNAGRGINRKRHEWLTFYFERLQDRLREVRVCCGDWRRVLGPTPTTKQGLTAVFLDPPYSTPDRDDVYNHDSFEVAAGVRQWAIDHGDDPLLRIALCGYDDFDMPPGWTLETWSTQGGYENQSQASSGNRHRECIWFSPHCLKTETARQLSLLEVMG